MRSLRAVLVSSRAHAPRKAVQSTKASAWGSRRSYADEKLPPDYPKTPKESDVVLHPPPESATEVQRPTPNVLAAVEAIKKLTFVEFISFGHEIARLSGIPYERLISGARSFQAGPVGAMPMDAGQQAQAAPAAAAPAEEKKEEKPAKKEVAAADVKLISFPEGAKFNVLREIRKLKPGMNLMDSKKLVENLPQILAKKVPKEELKDWEAGLKAAGAEFEFVEA